jgi:hypothetical protein
MTKSINESGVVSKESRTIVVCGAGNASHVCVREFSSNGFAVDVFAPFQNESERWNHDYDIACYPHSSRTDEVGEYVTEMWNGTSIRKNEIFLIFNII